MTRKVNPKSLENLKKRKPFVKGDPRINRMGRASNFDQLRELFQGIANEDVKDGNEIKSRVRLIGEELAKDKRFMREFLEFAYGKVPLSQIVDITSGGKAINWTQFINNDSDDNGNSTEDKPKETS